MGEKFLAKYQYFIQCVVVKNEGRGCEFSDVENLVETMTDEEVAEVGSISLPALHGNTMFKVNKLGLSFWAAINSQEQGMQGMTLMERQRTKVWMMKAQGELASVMGRLSRNVSE